MAANSCSVFDRHLEISRRPKSEPAKPGIHPELACCARSGVDRHIRSPRLTCSCRRESPRPTPEAQPQDFNPQPGCSCGGFNTLLPLSNRSVDALLDLDFLPIVAKLSVQSLASALITVFGWLFGRVEEC